MSYPYVQPITSPWRMQALDGHQIDYLDGAPAGTPTYEVQTPPMTSPAMYNDGMYHYTSAGGTDATLQSELNQRPIIGCTMPVHVHQNPFIVVPSSSTYTPTQPTISPASLYGGGHVDHVLSSPLSNTPRPPSSHYDELPQTIPMRPTLTRRDLSMTSISSVLSAVPSYPTPLDLMDVSELESTRRTLELLAETDAYLRNSPNIDSSIDNYNPFSFDLGYPDNLPLEPTTYDPERASVESDKSYSSFWSGSSTTLATSTALEEATQVNSTNPSTLAAVCLPGSLCESPGDASRVAPEVVASASIVGSPSPSTSRSYSSHHSVVPQESEVPFSPGDHVAPCTESVSTSTEPPIRPQEKQAAREVGMHSVVATVPAETADSWRFESPAKDAAPTTKPPPPATPPLAVKEEIIDSDDIDEIVREWSRPLDLASVVKTRRRKQQTSILRATMSSHRMPAHFKKRAQDASRKTSSSQTPSKTPSPPPPQRYYPRSPSPYNPLPPPLPIIIAPPLVQAGPPQSLRAIQAKPRATKPVQPRKPRVTKSAAVASRASPAQHPATGRPSKACVFCRRRKIGCTQSDSSGESCQQCLDRHITCEYPPDVQLAGLAHSSSSSSLVSRRPRRENKRDFM